MNIKKYLVIGGKPVSYSSTVVNCSGCRITNSAPKLKAHERAFKLNLSIPDELFLEPELKIEVTIPSSSVNKKQIKAEVVDNVTEVLEQKHGLNVKVSVVDVGEGE